MKRLSTPFAALLFLILAITYWQIDVTGSLAGDKGPFFFATSDLYTLYYPLIHYGIGSIKSLQIPLWNPYQSLGAPFLGSALFGLFSPFSFLYYILPTHLAMAYATVFNIVLTGLFTFLFLHKSLKTGTAGAIIGGLVFMFSGPLVLQITHPSLLGAMAFLPLLLFLTHKVFRSGEGRWAVFFALALACQMLTGAIQIITHTIFMTTAYGAGLLWMDWKDGKANARPIILLLIGGTIAIALSSVQWLPLMELSGFSGRSTAGLSLQDVEPFRDLYTPWNIGYGLLFSGSGIYVGIIPLLLSLAAPFNRRVRAFAVFFACTAILSLLLAFGTHTPLYSIYYHYTPTGKMFRVPTRWLWLTAFSISILTAMGAERIFTGFEKKRWLRTALCIILPFIITAFLFRHNVMKLNNYPQKTPGVFTRHSKEGAFLRNIQGTSRTYISSDFYHDYSMLQKFGTIEKVFVLNDYESLSLDAYKKFVAYVRHDKKMLNQKIFYGSYMLVSKKRDMRLLNLLSVRFIMENGKTKIFNPHQLKGLKKIYEDNGVRIYKNLNALPRAYVVYNSETIDDAEVALNRLASPLFKPRRSVILDRDAGLGQDRKPGHGKARIIKFLPERIELQTKLNRRGVLVLTDFFYPGWQAFVDGEPKDILRANTIMRGLVLEKGRHKVIFVYRPLPFRIGFWVCILTLAGLIIYLGADTLKRRRRRPL